MTDEQNNHLNGILNDVDDLIAKKYEKGAKEHGGNLWEKKGLIDMAIDEAIDQVVYLLTLREQLELAGIELGSKTDEA